MVEIIDIHVHFGAPYDPASGCYWSETFEKTAAYWFMKLMSGSLFKKLTIAHIEKKLLEIINDSKKVDKCVLLAMDKVYDENGNAKDNETHLYVPNTYKKPCRKTIPVYSSGHPFTPIERIGKTNWSTASLMARVYANGYLHHSKSTRQTTNAYLSTKR